MMYVDLDFCKVDFEYLSYNLEWIN